MVTAQAFVVMLSTLNSSDNGSERTMVLETTIEMII